MKRMLCLILMALSCFLTSCSVISPQENIRPRYQSYEEIPEVTQEDIDSIKALLVEKPRLVYGICVSTEAFLRDDGSVGGFAALLCDRLSELFGFEFDFYPCSWDEMNEKIVSGEIDVVGDFTATPERLQKFIMTDAIIQRTIKIFTDINAESLNVTSKTRPIRCAFMNGSTTYSLVSDSWDIPFEPVFIDNQSEVPHLLLTGKIDAFIEEGTLEATYDAYDFIKAETYYPLTYSPISLTTGNPQIAPFISVMQKYLQNGGSYELTELYNQGYKDYLKHRLYSHLTDEEKEYILQHNSAETAILAACEVDHYPSSFYNKKERQFQGIAFDILDRVAEVTGLNFQVGNRPNASWPELLDGLEIGKYAIVTELLQTAPRQGRFLWADEPCYTDYYAMLSKSDYPDVDINQILFAKIGLFKESAHSDIFWEWFPNSANTVTYDSIEEAFAALERGDVELLMASQNLLLHLVNYLEKPGFKANIIFNYSSDSFFGFNKDEEVLCSIINKSMRYIDTKEISTRWQQKSFDYQSKMLKDTIPFVVAFAAVLIAVLLVVILLFAKNKQINKNLEKLVAERTNELELQTSTLTTMFESIPDIVFCKDLDLRFTRCNRSFEKHFGCIEKDIIGKDDESGLGLPSDIAEGFREADRTIISGKRVIAVEEYIPSVDGTAPLFETIKTPLMQNGEPIGIMGISRDITQRKMAEETLKLTLDNLNAFIYITEIDTGKILFMNESMAKEFGCEDYYGKICWQVLQNGFTEQCEFCPVPKLLESGDEYYVWEEYNTATGKYYKDTDSLIRWHDGRLVHMQHSVDITDLIKLQQDLGQASKAKSDFLSRMSHEIRTPLNAVIGMIGIALNTNDTEKIKHYIGKADDASKHLLGVINDILDMSKIEADKFELSYSEFDFEKVLINITNVINFRAEEKHQNLVVNLGAGVPAFVFGDELRLSQVITNLLSNAVKFTPEDGTVVLSVEKINDTGSEVTLQIEISDNGIGISEEQQKRLFTSFEQADGSISRKFGGTGLGLAISKRIVELMGGRIWIESEPDKGSRFIFTIKAKKGKEKTHAKLSSKINRENVRILAVDDSEEIRTCFSHILEAHNLPCDVAANGSEALDKLKNCGDKPYNIFFIDWQMPEMNGIELTKRVKEMTHDNSIVFMISVSDWSNIEKEALSAGVNGFISKPLFPSSLIDSINECFGVESKKTEAYVQRIKKGYDFSGHAILIAEDVEINQEIMVALLEDTGVSIDFADNGKVAISMFEENPSKYSLILMDIHMPEMDGYEATRTIRSIESEQAKSIPIIAMTANVFKEDIEHCLLAGMNDHIGKPIDADCLFGKLSQYLS